MFCERASSRYICRIVNLVNWKINIYKIKSRASTHIKVGEVRKRRKIMMAHIHPRIRFKEWLEAFRL